MLTLAALYSLAVAPAAWATPPLLVGTHAVSPTCEALVQESAPDSGRYSITFKQSGVASNVHFEFDSKADTVIIGNVDCEGASQSVALKGSKFSLYTSHCGSLFKQVSGQARLIFDRTTGTLVAAQASMDVARWTLGGLHSGPLKMPSDRLACARPEVTEENITRVNSVDMLDELAKVTSGAPLVTESH